MPNNEPTDTKEIIVPGELSGLGKTMMTTVKKELEKPGTLVEDIEQIFPDNIVLTGKKRTRNEEIITKEGNTIETSAREIVAQTGEKEKKEGVFAKIHEQYLEKSIKSSPHKEKTEAKVEEISGGFMDTNIFDHTVSDKIGSGNNTKNNNLTILLIIIVLFLLYYFSDTISYFIYYIIDGVSSCLKKLIVKVLKC